MRQLLLLLCALPTIATWRMSSPLDRLLQLRGLGAPATGAGGGGVGGLGSADNCTTMLMPRPVVGNCTAHSGVKPPQLLKTFTWIHIPKAGSSLATTLYHYACPLLPKDAVPQLTNDTLHGSAVIQFEKVCPFELFCNMGASRWSGHRFAHTPLMLDRFTNLSSVVLMVRDPRRRLLSAYNYGLHATGIPESEKTKMRAEVKTLEQYINYPGIQGCQVKMMVGVPCNARVPVTPDMLSKAVENVKQVGFVGDTDEWNDSICLFHAMHGGELSPHSFTDIRPTLNGHYNHTELVVRAEDDPYDWEFYLEAKAVMRRNQEIYGLPVYVPPANSSISS